MQFTFFLILVGFSLLAEEQVEPHYIQQSKNDPQYGANIRKSEQVLNQNISKANQSLSPYSRILSMKVNSLPHKTIVTKGITKGNDCILNRDQDKFADCLKVEQFDFIEGDIGTKGDARGSKSKSMILFYESGDDKKKLSEAKLVKVKSRFLSHNLYTFDKKVVEVLDTDPLGNPDHDDKIFITSEIDDVNGEPQGLNSIENTKSNPIRNQFKREAYIKHLLFFEKILSKIYHYNESSSNKK